MRLRALVLIAALASAGGAMAQPAPKPAPDDPAADTRPPARPAATTPDPASTSQVDQPGRAQFETSDFDHSACLLALTLLGVTYQQQPPVTDPENPGCGIDRPVLVAEVQPGVALHGGAPMRCELARSLALWTRDFVRPAAARLPRAPQLSGYRLGSTYQCRGRIGGDGGTGRMSEHAFGNALDIASFTFADAPDLAVEPRDGSGLPEMAFQRAARATACLFFTTVLGPGSDGAHDDHLHLDMAQRRGDWRLCQ
ncbi:MAG: extensin family protein [Paracoccus sp. (in: a-proteobacteria)]|uniref:extensin-like domain-containing protein n=1 Tax=Paracoccus sp. TaxID=267 RepID=UPI0026DFAF3B|nr:extensin family protein [Paracoccus sp. (in: a-proteobacteria)]MDO5631799.1 extensin family protein [Paracoccus sp. (in: a-proteobacteria)]